ncbi:MAG TPA: carbohydrate ABC transporter permease [Chloroflexota bacterium]|nr:carbohydrate ABC transporter permease [Chloroflexota bacterium]
MEQVARWTWQRYLQLAALVVLAAWTLWPLAYMFSTSLKSTAEVTLNVAGLIPQHPTLGNYSQILSDNQDPIGRWFFNSAVAVAGGTLLTLLCASLAAYGLSRLEWPGRDWFFYAILAATLIPGITFIIPMFSEFAKAGLLNTYWPIILVYPAGAFGVFLLRQFYLSIPREIEEAAIIDGAGKFRRWFQIILPMTRTPLVTLTILTAVGIYNDFLWPLIVMQSKDMYTITVGIYLVTAGAYVNNYGPLMAFSTIAAVPTIVLFILLQRHFVASAALSGVKG